MSTELQSGTQDGTIDVEAMVARAEEQKKKEKLFNKKSTPLYLMILPALSIVALYKYGTMWGHAIAFADWRISGFNGWVGFTHFEFLFELYYFWRAFWNQWRIIVIGYIFLLPAPIIFALLLNEIRQKAYKKTVQTLTILPNFVNWVVIGGIFITILSPRYGYINDLIRILGGDPIFFMSKPKLFPWLLTFIRGWKSVGYSSIIYLAALSGVDEELYESAVIDGAGRLRQTWHVTLPALKPTIVILFVLSFANVWQALFEPVYVLQNPMVISHAEVLDTYIFKVGLRQAKYGLGAAAGLFKATISIAFLFTANWASKNFTEDKRSIL
jgi:putative aldouronate transport system permease protein